jgi:hypothetical protein
MVQIQKFTESRAGAEQLRNCRSFAPEQLINTQLPWDSVTGNPLFFQYSSILRKLMVYICFPSAADGFIAEFEANASDGCADVVFEVLKLQDAPKLDANFGFF